ncbi:MAG: hypothetical protein JRF25_02275 [Deltaproteobacteria bacterium]|nr:hypothetical protein [Deltaproteobacteria bacterium]
MKYMEEYKAKYNEGLSSFGGHAWDALYIVAAALEAVGNDKAKIRDYIENIKGYVGQMLVSMAFLIFHRMTTMA